MEPIGDIYTSMVQPKGPAYRDSQIVAHSHYKDPIDHAEGRLAGNSRIWGDASQEVQSRVIDKLIGASEKAGLTPHETAYVLATARVESGFNPDAAAGTTSAYGLGQFIDQTGNAYGLNSSTRNDVDKQAEALVAHYMDNRNIARARSQGEEYIYKYHHDGPSMDYGGLGLSRREVMPRLAQYEQFVIDHRQQRGLTSPPLAQPTPSVSGMATLKSGARGAEVAQLQETLNTLGYTNRKGQSLATDADFGPSTKEAVQAFQRANGLQDDGIVGARTMAALTQAQQAQQQQNSAPAQTGPSAPASVSLADPVHPQHALFQQSYDGLKKLDPARLGFTSEQQYLNAAGTTAFEAAVSGLKQIDHMALNRDGTGLTAVQGALDDPGHQRVYMDKNQAAAQPLEHSSSLLREEMQQQQQTQTHQVQKQSTPGLSM